MSNPVIVRNNIPKEFVEDQIGKKSKNYAGVKFFTPKVTEESLATDMDWIGKGEVARTLTKVLRPIFADIHIDNLDKNTGLLNMQSWEVDAGKFTAGVAKLSDIEEELDDLQARQQTIVLSENFGAEEEVDVNGEKRMVKTAPAQELETQMKEIADLIRPLRIERAKIMAEYADRAEKRKATKAAEEAAAGTKPAVAAAA